MTSPGRVSSGQGILRRWLAAPGTSGLDIDDPQNVAELRRLIQEKGFLRKLYEDWFAAIVAALPSGAGAVLELGAGGGFLSDLIPGLITSEVQMCSHVRLVPDGQALPLRDNRLRAIVMTDVLHHLPESRRFLREAARCVKQGGRIVMVEPWVSPWLSFVYRRFHHEPFRPETREWEFPRGGPLSAANMALPWVMLVRDREIFDREFPQWRIRSIRPMMPFRYLPSGGVSMRSLTPASTYGFWRALESALSPWSTPSQCSRTSFLNERMNEPMRN